MSLFWAYFRDKLRFAPIQRPGPLAALAEGAAAALDTVREVMLKLREQFFPEKCEQELLKRYARSRGIVRVPLEPEAHWLYRVRFAYLWWRSGGRGGAMAITLTNYFGFLSVTIENLRGEDPERWAEFRVRAELIGSDPSVAPEQVEWAINEMKPARSKLAGLEFIVSALGGVPTWSFGLTSAEIVTVVMEVEDPGGGQADEIPAGALLDGAGNWLIDGQENWLQHNNE